MSGTFTTLAKIMTVTNDFAEVRGFIRDNASNFATAFEMSLESLSDMLETDDSTLARSIKRAVKKYNERQREERNNTPLAHMGVHNGAGLNVPMLLSRLTSRHHAIAFRLPGGNTLEMAQATLCRLRDLKRTDVTIAINADTATLHVRWNGGKGGMNLRLQRNVYASAHTVIDGKALPCAVTEIVFDDSVEPWVPTPAAPKPARRARAAKKTIIATIAPVSIAVAPPAPEQVQCFICGHDAPECTSATYKTKTGTNHACYTCVTNLHQWSHGKRGRSVELLAPIARETRPIAIPALSALFSIEASWCAVAAPGNDIAPIPATVPVSTKPRNHTRKPAQLFTWSETVW